ncbi:MAG: carboxypeptidase-like regulatory domain-containing protein [Alistipes sp.]|nr:carboxypeptidase-like regulatory domain-containing protein [Alistipes sp.]
MLIGLFAVATVSCSDDDENGNVGYGTVTGIVTDYEDTPLDGVTVSVQDMDATATTASDGSYTIQNVPMDSRVITFTKLQYQTTSATLTADRYVNGTAMISVSMDYANGVISGTVYDARSNYAPLSGVTVTLGNEITQTASDGTYKFEYLSIDDYDLVFSKENYNDVERTIYATDFVDGVAVLDVNLGEDILLPGKTIYELQNADKWYYNEYRGGRNAQEYPHWDWSVDYMCALDFWGNWEEQNEGTTLRTRNDGSEQNNPADMDNFDSYVYGSKLITADNYVLSLNVRTHNADAASPAYFGVQVIDLSDANPSMVKLNTYTHGSDSYSDYDFDLSAYIGKEVIIAVGIYRAETGDYWKQLCLRAIRFAHEKVEGYGWLPGTQVISGMQLPIEAVRSTMPHTKKSFTGLGSITGFDSGSSWQAYREYREIDHVALEWAFVPLLKDPEPHPSEGYLIKTRSNELPNTMIPEAYLYAKFNIEPGCNNLNFRTRNFSNDPTYFKLLAITMDGSYEAIDPYTYPAGATNEADGCWSFVHQSGGGSNLDDYALFQYDLSKFNGQEVLLVISVHNGQQNGTENKLVMRHIELN